LKWLLPLVSLAFGSLLLYGGTRRHRVSHVLI
jgi:hypothetical protein